MFLVFSYIFRTLFRTSIILAINGFAYKWNLDFYIKYIQTELEKRGGSDFHYSVYYNILVIPFAMKPLFGFISDSFHLFRYR